jgi:hypothetical protein
LSASEFIPALRNAFADAVVLDVRLDNHRGITGLVLRWTWENPKERVIESFLRVCFGFGCMILLVQFLINLKALPFKVWHLEQQFTAILLAVAVLSDNPVFFIGARQVHIFQSYVTPAFTILMLIYVVVIFDVFQYRNQVLDRYFFAPKLCLVVVFLMGEWLGFAGLAHCVTAAWATALIITTSFGDGDPPQRYRFAVYTWTFAVSAAVLILTECVLPETSLRDIMRFALDNVFIILMTMLHCPLPRAPVDPHLRGVDPALQSVNVDV